MSQILSIFAGNRATDIGLAYQYLDIYNWFEEEDPIDHRVLFDNNKRPRSIFLGQQMPIKRVLNTIKINQQTEEQQQKQEIVQEVISQGDLDTQTYLNQMNVDNRQLCEFNGNFEQDHGLFTYELNSRDLDGFEDILCSELERFDRFDGLQMIVDCESKYGQIGLSILELVNDMQGNKVTNLVFGLLNNTEELNQIVNKVLTLTSYNQTSDILIPLYMDVNRMDYFNVHGNIIQQLSMVINNITGSYRCVDEYATLNEFYQRVVPLKQNNVFNLYSQYPTMTDSKDNSILNFKQQLSKQNPINIPNYMDKIIMYDENYASYGESYFLRGMSPIPDQNNIRSYGVDIRLLEDIYLVPDCYKQLCMMETQNMPLHTCIFSNECYKYTLKNSLNQFEGVKSNQLLQYQKQSIEESQEIRHSLEQMIENYGGIDYDL